MRPALLSGCLVLAAALLLSVDALVLKVSTDQVEVGKTKNVSLACVGSQHLSDISEVIMVRILKKDVTGWTTAAERGGAGTGVTTTGDDDVIAEASKANSYLRLTWPVATNDTIGQYRCDVIGWTSQMSVSWQKSLPIFISRKSNVTLQALSQVVEENTESLQRLGSQTQTIMDNFTTSAAHSRRECLRHTRHMLHNLTARLNALETRVDSRWESQLQALGRVAEQEKRQCPDHNLAHIGQVLEQIVVIIEQGKQEFLQQKDEAIENVKATVEQHRRELLQQKEDVLESVSATVEQSKTEILQQKEDILDSINAARREFLQQKDDIQENVTAIAQAFEASLESRLEARKIQQQPRTCAEAQGHGHRPVVTLFHGVTVVCDTETDGGGWVVIQRRASRDVSFFRGWTDYKYGFGNFSTNFWLGLEKIHQLTNMRRHELRIDFTFKGKDYHAIYGNFSLSGESDDYKIHISGFSGNVEDNMDFHNGQAFTTKDRDNDSSESRNCAREFHGGWWYNDCHRVNLNGLWRSTESSSGMNWKSVTKYNDSVSFSEMKIRPK
ncbi:fibrinogen C domain-containing protein 1 [Aplysia californica]|uniref:Fibrinogen C domain-containing protein 1 n=1 Tax=Aplysia californica TaxID=6500 RepID=A0ABM0K9L5_APLCA|nr:fibrinogen C domain-containing protein 1 [Aplysia californica]